MATSGAMSTDNQYVKYTISVTQNSQSITNNTSNVTVSVRFYRTNTGYTTYGTGTIYCKINGTTYSASVTPSHKITNSGIVLFTKTLNISHNTDGTKTLTCSAWISHNSLMSNEQSYSQALTTIPRKSTLTAGNGTLGTAQTLTVTRQSTSFTHTITYKCGSASGTVCTKSSNTSVSFTPPLTLANQNTSGTNVSVTFTITTYNGNTSVGSNAKTISCVIPASVKPTVSIAVSDATSYSSTYGSYIQGMSKFKITVTESGSYGSTIKSRKTTADGKSYTTTSITTGVIAGSGSMTITATVTDSRNRTATASKTVTVTAYSAPKISSVKAIRTDSNGVPLSSGNYLTVSFTSMISALSNKNTASYKIQYKKIEDSTYTTITLTKYANMYDMEDGVYTFAASQTSSYDVILTVSDAFGSISRTATGASIKKLWSILTKGMGIALGKIAELANTFECALDAKFNGAVYGNVMGLNKLPEIPANSDLNSYMETGSYAVYKNANAETIANMPVQRAGRLEVSSATGEGIRAEQWSYLRQRFIPYNSSNAVWERDITRNEANVWTYYDWWQSSLTPAVAERVYSKAAITARLASNKTLGTVNTYTKIPLDATMWSTSDRLTTSDDVVRIGANMSYVKVSGNILAKNGSVNGNRHARIQKVSGSTTTSISWVCIYGTATHNELYGFSPVIVPVKEGDLIQMVYYTGDAEDSIDAGSTANGLQTYLTVEEL